MKKLSYLLSLTAVAGMVLLYSCGKDEDPEPVVTTPDACAEATEFLSGATGDAAIVLKNFSSDVIQVEAGNILSLAVEVTKGSSRTKKIHLWQSDCEKLIGTEIDLSDQPKGGKNGIDLRNTDDAQIRNVNYTVPTGMDPIYLTIEVTEGGGNMVYKQLTLNVTGSGLVTLSAGIELGGNSNALASRMATATGLTYSACNAAANIDYVDLTYAVGIVTPYTMYLCSNPARFASPISLSTSTASCGDDGSLSTAGGSKSYFAPYTGTLSPSTATSTDLDALAVASDNDQYIEVAAVGDKFEFMNPDGLKGLIEVTAISGPNTTGGSCTVSVVVQR